MHNENLQKIRKTINLSQEDISTQLGISYRAYTSYERGDRKIPIEVLEILCDKFNVNLNWLICNKGNMFNTKPFEQVEKELEQKVVEVMKKYGVIEK